MAIGQEAKLCFPKRHIGLIWLRKTHMPTRSEVSDHEPELEASLEDISVTFPCEAIPYLLATVDALVILLASLFGGFIYHWSFGTLIPDLSAYFALGLIASFIHIIRLGGRGYYDFESAAKPSVEIVEVLISWFTTGLMLAFFAFLFKIGESFSRGSFLVFLAVAPVGLLAGRKISKFLIARAVARGAIGRRNLVLLGDPVELDSLEPRDLLAFFGAGEVNRFTLSADSDPLVQKSNNTKTLDLVANFIRKNNTAEILLALPWSDSARIELIREPDQDAASFRKTVAGRANSNAHELCFVWTSAHHLARNSARTAQHN